MGPAGRGSRLAIAAAMTLALFLVPAGASASVTCGFDPDSKVVDVVLDAAGDVAIVGLQGDAVTVDGSPCGSAMTTSTDLIRVRDTSADATTLAIDLGGGSFAPGATDEPGTSDEIEFDVDLGSGAGDEIRVLGSGTGDAIVVGADGIQLDATETDGIDADVAPLEGAESIRLSGGGGNDELRADGGAGTGAAAVLATAILGDSGADTLASGAGPDALDGGSGFDTADYSGRIAPVAVTLDGTAGDGEGGELDDVLPTVEGLIGGTVEDHLVGGEAANLIDGGAGADLIEGLGGDDTIRGGEGDDDIHGGEGYDLIEGGPGADDEFGDGNNDVFQMSSPAIYRSGGDPVSIPNDGSELVLTMDVTAPGQMRDINVRLDIEHGDPSELFVETISPFGVPNVMTNHNGAGNPTPMRGITFDSESVATVKRDGGTFPLDGRFHPRGSLDSLYRGKQAAGTWQLVIRDDNGGAAGQINWWSLDINYTTTETDGSGDVLTGGEGNFDMIDYTARSKNLKLTLDGGAANDGQRSEGDQILEIEDTYAGTGHDVLRGTNSRNDIRGHYGNDTLYLFDGNDKGRGGQGNDVLWAGPGSDVTVYGNDGDDTVHGEDGDDRIDTGSGNDTADGGAGTDVCRLAETEIDCEA